MLEALVEVDGQWLRLGDLSSRQCRLLQHMHTAAAARSRELASAFARLADALGASETVRHRWTSEQLRSIFGDTLDAAPAQPAST